MKIHRFDNGSYIIAEQISLGANVRVGPNVSIRATSCTIGNDVTIGANTTFLVGQELRIGDLTNIGARNNLTGRVIDIGQYVYWDTDVLVGHGGRFSENSRLRVGSYSMICARIVLNINYPVTIGEYVGIGEDVSIWTHGSYPPVLEGFPADFGPVTIGNRVWLPAKSTVLPNRTIGDDVVIGTNSLINKDLPSGCLAGGIPVKILKENVYPNRDAARNRAIVERIVRDYEPLAAYKELKVSLRFDPERMTLACNDVTFDLEAMTTRGTLTATEEDFRDFLRRRGIKFYTGRPFASVLPPEYQRLLNVSPDAS